MPPFVCIDFSNHIELSLNDYPTKPAGFVVIHSGCLRWVQDEQDRQVTKNHFTFLSRHTLSHSIDLDTAFEATLILIDYEMLIKFSPAVTDQKIHQPICLFDIEPFEYHLLNALMASSQLLLSRTEVQQGLIHSLISYTTDKYPHLFDAIQFATQASFSEKVSLFMDSRLDKEQSLPMLADHLKVSVTTVKRRLAEDGLSFTEMLKKKESTKVPPYCDLDVQVSLKSHPCAVLTAQLILTTLSKVFMAVRHRYLGENAEPLKPVSINFRL